MQTPSSGERSERVYETESVEEVAVAKTHIGQNGWVEMDDGIFPAISISGSVQAGEEVKIVGTEGNTYIIVPIAEAESTSFGFYWNFGWR